MLLLRSDSMGAAFLLNPFKWYYSKNNYNLKNISLKEKKSF